MPVALDSIGNYLSRLGIAGEDPGATARPIARAPLTQHEQNTLYEQVDLATRGVDEIVEDALKDDSFEIYRSKDAATPIDLSELPFDLQAVFEEAGKTARLTGNAFIFMITGTDPSVPRNPDSEILGLVVLSRYEVEPLTYYSKITEPKFGEVETYELHPEQPDGGYQTSVPRVHESHLIRLAGHKLPRQSRLRKQGFDDSVLEVAWNSIRNFISTEQAMALIVQRFETATLGIAGLAEAQSIEDGTEMIQQRMQWAMQSLSMLNAMLVDVDAGENYERKFATVSGLDTIWDRMAHSAAKAFGYPMTKLFGMSPSGQSTDDESGRANWRKIVYAYRAKELTPGLETIGRTIAGEDVVVRWKPIDEATAKEEAEIDVLKAQAEDVRIKAGTVHRLEVRAKLLEEGYVADGGEEPPDPRELQLEHALIQNQAAAARAGNEMPENGENEGESGNIPPNSDEEE